MILTKKGLSDIITNVLIILLVLVAIGIIWAFIRPTINDASGNLKGAADCLTIQVKPVSCDYTTNTVIVQRGSGSGKLTGLKLLVTNAGNTATLDDVSTGPTGVTALDELETYTINTNGDPDIEQDDKIEVAAMVEGAEGSKTCAQSPEFIICSQGS